MPRLSVSDPSRGSARPASGCLRGSARRARSTVVTAVLAVLGLTAGLAAFVHARPGFRDPLFADKVDVFGERTAARPDALRVVVVGSSRSAAAVEPRTLGAAAGAAAGRPCVALNLSIAGDGPIFQHVHVRRLLARGPVPDVVVLECLPLAFAWTAAGPHDVMVLKPSRLTWDELDVVIGYGCPAKVRDQWVETMANPVGGFKFHLLARVRPRWRPPGVLIGNADRPGVEREDGWGAWDPFPPAVAARRTAEALTKYRPSVRAIDFDRPHAAAFRDSIRLLRAAGARVVVVVTPESAAFRDCYPPDVEARVRGFLADIGREFGVPVVDTRAWLPDEAFADGHHVLRTWAAGYTERLARAGGGLGGAGRAGAGE